MTCKVIGVEHRNFTAPDGNQISGMDIYVAYEDRRTEGLRAERVFLSDRKMEGYIPVPGDYVKLEYNRYGKVDVISQVPAPSGK